MGDEVHFLPADKHESSLSHWVCLSRHAQSTQSKFAISLQYLKKNVKDEVDFLPTDKRQRFLQIDAMIFVVCGQACLNYPKWLSSNLYYDFRFVARHA